MRIIAGELKGRKLATPTDQTIRPTSDKVKEALFSILAPYLGDATVVDLFSGTGGLGLEAVSRGARHVYFGDKSRSGIELTKRNIAHCQVENRTSVIWGSWEQTLNRIGEPVDIILLDPPYKAGMLLECIEKIQELSLLKPDGILVAEHGKKESLPDQINGLEKDRVKTYGKIAVSVYFHKEAEIDDGEDD